MFVQRNGVDVVLGLGVIVEFGYINIRFQLSSVVGTYLA